MGGMRGMRGMGGMRGMRGMRGEGSGMAMKEKDGRDKPYKIKIKMEI